MAAKKTTDVIALSHEDVSKAKLAFHYIKSNYFRVIHADGVYGGISPKGKIQMAFFSERQPIPQQTVFAFDPKSQSTTGEIEGERVTREGVVREVEANILMDLDTARTFSTWISEKIVELEKVSEQMKAARSKVAKNAKR